jgi:hypothetical protein
MINSYFEQNEVKSDEFGRIIIQDLSILEKINGATMGTPEFMIPDVACGNANCGC